MAWSDICGERTLLAITTDVRHPFDPDANGVAIDLDGLIVFAFEDPSDGYRSTCAEPLIAHDNLYSFGVSPDYLRVPVMVREIDRHTDHAFEGVEMIDRRNGKTILVLGTNNTDDYYPYYTCEWSPQNIADNRGN